MPTGSSEARSTRTRGITDGPRNPQAPGVVRRALAGLRHDAGDHRLCNSTDDHLSPSDTTRRCHRRRRARPLCRSVGKARQQAGPVDQAEPRLRARPSRRAGGGGPRPVRAGRPHVPLGWQLRRIVGRHARRARARKGLHRRGRVRRLDRVGQSERAVPHRGRRVEFRPIVEIRAHSRDNPPPASRSSDHRRARKPSRPACTAGPPTPARKPQFRPGDQRCQAWRPRCSSFPGPRS